MKDICIIAFILLTTYLLMVIFAMFREFDNERGYQNRREDRKWKRGKRQ